MYSKIDWVCDLKELKNGNIISGSDDRTIKICERI
jgi:hypothetical protein